MSGAGPCLPKHLPPCVEGVYCATGVDLSYSIIQDGDTRELKEFAVVISQGDSVLDIESFETMLKAKQFVQQHEDGQSTHDNESDNGRYQGDPRRGP